MKYVFLLVAIALAGTFFSCEKEPTQAEKDDEIIRNYLSDNGLEAEKHSSGLYYHITKPGSGGHPDLSMTVQVGYKGYLTDGTVFDQTEGTTTREFALSQLIPGWQIAIPMLQRGGEGMFYIPSALAYGGAARSGIPANSVLIFEIRLVHFFRESPF